MNVVNITRFFAPLVATAMILVPATSVFAEHKAVVFSVLDLSTPPSLDRPEIVDADGNPIFWSTPMVDTSQTLVYTQDPFSGADEGVVPVLDTKGNQVFLRDWMKARGKLTVQCVRKGTQYEFRLRGLIPNGVYTIWHFPDSGAGALATTFPFEKVDNVFHASKSGNAKVKVVAEMGPMSFGGTMPACSLTESTQEFFVVLYHIDGEYCGAFPCNGPGKMSVETAHIFFKR